MGSELGLYGALLVLQLIALNFLCWIAFKLWPRLLLSENERLSIEYFERFDGDLWPYVPEWFDIKATDWPDLVKDIHNIQRIGGHVYEDFVGFTTPAYSGRLVNFHAAKFRHVRNQGPWPISPQFFNIFFFGGSTTQNVGPDWTSIPSYLQEELDGQPIDGRPIRVYNFGCGSYFSTQERILLQQLLLGNSVPDAVMFLDGVNDFYFYDGRSAIAGFFAHALDEHNRENREANLNRTTGRVKWLRLTQFAESLPLVRALRIVGETLAKRNAAPADVLYKPTVIDPDALQPAIDRYLENKSQIEAICRARGIATVFVWQPTPAYKYDLHYHVALSRHYGLGGHERSGVGYMLMAKRLETQPMTRNFIWLADIQEGEKRPLYLDNMHYVCDFRRTIARHIAQSVVTHGLLNRQSQHAEALQ